VAKISRKMKSEMGWSNASRVVVRGLDLCTEVLGKLNLVDLAFLEIAGRKPLPNESAVFNALLCTLVEHGMTPTAMVARLTYLGAPESFQAAVAAGLCGMGTHFAGTAEGSAKWLQEAIVGKPQPIDIQSVARDIVASHVEKKQFITGLGHPYHKPVDPRTSVLFDLAQANGLSGDYIRLINAVSREAERVLNKPGILPVNASGAVGALACELGFDWKISRGFAIIGRAIGLVGHIAEEIQHPIAEELWLRTEEEVSADTRRLFEQGQAQ
jgi:citrate synthase